MKEAFGGVGLFIIVIIFLTIFSSYLALSVNYSRAFKVRDEVINIIERDKGLYNSLGQDTGAIDEIQEYMASVGHRAKGKCDDGYEGYSLSSEGTTDRDVVVCIQTINSSTYRDVTTSKYYKVQVFFSLDIPIFGQYFGSSLKGTTRRIIIAR